VVGIGPGGPEHRTFKAQQTILDCEIIAGYPPYLESITDLTEGKDLISSGMRQEVSRVRAALDAAASEKQVALVSSGDSGIYGMAGLALEMSQKESYNVDIEIIPGVTAANAAAAALGAPLMLDFCTISLSDLLVSWDIIRKRIKAVAEADFVTALYNPRSKKRIKQLNETVEIFLQHRDGSTPVGIVHSAGTVEEKVVLTDLNNLLNQEVGMRSMVIIGNSSGKVVDHKFFTPRGYEV